MKLVIAAVLFGAICHPYVMTNAQDCQTERDVFITSKNSSVNCSLVLSRVVDLVISRNFTSSSSADLDLVCMQPGNNTDVCQDGIMNYFTACRSIEAVRLVNNSMILSSDLITFHFSAVALDRPKC